MRSGGTPDALGRAWAGSFGGSPKATPFEDSGTYHTAADQRGLYTPRLGRLTSAARGPLTELAGEPEQQAFELQAVGHAAAAFEVAVGVGKAGEELVSAGPAQAFQVAL